MDRDLGEELCRIAPTAKLGAIDLTVLGGATSRWIINRHDVSHTKV